MKMAVLKHMKAPVAQLPVSNSHHNWVHQEGEERGRNRVLFLNTGHEACNFILSCESFGVCPPLIYLYSCKPIGVDSFKHALKL